MRTTSRDGTSGTNGPRDGLKKAIDYFSRAIETDPTYAEAYSGLADSYALAGDWLYGVLSPEDAFRQARAAATKALALDDTLGEAHTSLAFALDLYALGLGHRGEGIQAGNRAESRLRDGSPLVWLASARDGTDQRGHLRDEKSREP